MPKLSRFWQRRSASRFIIHRWLTSETILATPGAQSGSKAPESIGLKQHHSEHAAKGMAENVAKQHTGIPISEFLAGRGAAPTTTMPGPSPGTEAALARGMEAVRVGGATAARPHGGIHISEFLRRHEGPAGVAAGARVPADAVRRMLESLENPDGSVDAGQLVARIVEMSREGGDTCEYRMDDGNDGDY